MISSSCNSPSSYDDDTKIIQTIGLKRSVTDKYYTITSVVDKYTEIIRNTIVIDYDNDICIEPSAGNGSFIRNIKSLSKNYKFLDLHPEHNEIIKQDYLEFDYDKMVGLGFDKKHVIGNPPFGRQSSTAIRFIKKSMYYCDSISFILPRSFKKESLKKHFDLYFHLVYECDVPEYSFVVNNRKHDVPCVFQIWIKNTFKRTVPKKEIPYQYKFTKKEDDHDISFRRVGFNAGEICKITTTKSVQSHYFIKFDEQLTDKLVNKLSRIQFTCKDNTVGSRSISKQELIYEFNRCLTCDTL